jgi:hypothetical protein
MTTIANPRTTDTPRVISHRQIAAWGACSEQRNQIKDLYPDGVPLTRDAALSLHENGIDVLWGALRLLTEDERVEFLLFTLRQRQPYIVSLLRAAGLDQHASAVAALRFDTPDDARAATTILDTARAAARDAAWEATRDAAWAAWTAAWNAAWNAAWEATRDAAWAVWAATCTADRAAAWNAATREQIVWVCDRIEQRPEVTQ